MKRTLICVTTAAIMALSPGSMAFAESEPDYEECTLTLDWWGDDAVHQATINAIDAFMSKYPGLTVENTYGFRDGWEEAEALKFSAQSTSDVTQIKASWIPDYDADGQIFLDLNTVSDILDLSQWDDSLLTPCRNKEGALVSVPISMEGCILFFDKTTFDEIGVAIPTTTEELLEAGDAFAAYDEEYYPLVLDSYDRALFMTQYLSARYGKAAVEDGALTFSEKELKEGIQFIGSLVRHHVIPSIELMDDDDYSSAEEDPKWADGRYAGVYDWNSSLSRYADALDEGRELVVGDIPEEMKEGTFYRINLAFAIAARSEHAGEAAILMNYLLNNPEGVRFMGLARGIPASAIACRLLENAGVIDEQAMEAHRKIFSCARYYLDTSVFDDPILKDEEYGAFVDAFGGLDYGDYRIADAIEILTDAFAALR